MDAQYALSHYDEYASRYEEKSGNAEKQQSIPENEKEITTFADTGCVEGSWTGDDHVALIPVSNTNVRIGARFVDNKSYVDTTGDYTYATIGDNPWWHGSYNTNYIMAFEYATRMAEKAGSSSWKDGDCLDAVKTKGYTGADRMKADAKRIPWSSKNVLGKKEATQGRKRAVLWGMAIHTATDIYAHSVFVGKHHLSHETKKDDQGNDIPLDDWAVADDKYTYSNRYFEDAQNVAINCMAKYNAGESGDYTVFYVNGAIGPSYYRIKDIVSNVGESEGSTIGSLFTNYNYSYFTK